MAADAGGGLGGSRSGTGGADSREGFGRSDRAEQLARQPGDADQPGTDVRADDGPDLRDELRRAAVDLGAALGQALDDVGRLDVLDEEHVGAAVAPLLEAVDESLERAPRRAHALDRRDLALDREDRL